MNKKILSIFSLSAAITLLGGCDSKNSENANNSGDFVVTDTSVDPIVKYNENGQLIKINDPEDPANSKLSSLDIKEKFVSLFYSTAKDGSFNDEKKLTFTSLPYGASLSGVSWSSSNDAVATVDQNGVVKAVSEGMCEITLKNIDGSISSTSHVVVNEDKNKTKVASRKNSIIEMQSSSSFEQADTIFVTEDYIDTKRIVDGPVLYNYSFRQEMWASKTNAYFRIVSNDLEQKCEDGTPEPSRADYIFYTDKNTYFTYVFKTDGNKRNYMRVDQSSLISKGYTPFEALGLVIGNFFVAGSAIIDNQFTGATGGDALNDNSIWMNTKCIDCGGFNSEEKGQLGLRYTKVQSQVKVGEQDAEDLGIPAGTLVDVTDHISYLWENYKVNNKSINEIFEYSIGEESYVEDLQVDYYYQHNNVELYMPDPLRDNYSKVDTIFDL